jgi:hypothetical protein
MKTEKTRTRLSIDTLRVETFTPQQRPEALELVDPPTRPGNTFPPCCSDVLVCA